jgi:hypothetical protein
MATVLETHLTVLNLIKLTVECPECHHFTALQDAPNRMGEKNHLGNEWDFPFRCEQCRKELFVRIESRVLET